METFIFKVDVLATMAIGAVLLMMLGVKFYYDVKNLRRVVKAAEVYFALVVVVTLILIWK